MYDIIIVGAGPSGSAAGRQAGKLGLNTLLIDKQSFPRSKACAGAVSEEAMAYLGFDIPSDIIEKEIFGVRVHYKNHVIEKHKDSRLAILVTRSNYDNYLLRKAEETGIRINIPEIVYEYHMAEDYVSVVTNKNSYRSKYLLIAEGAHGSLKYTIRKKDKKNEYGICVVTDISEKEDLIDKYIHNAIDLYFDIANRGYGWIFPHNNYYSVGIGGLAKDITNPKQIMESFLSKNGFHGQYDLKIHLIPSGGINRRLACSRVLLCGDAAGFVDSFSGEGISYAIRSGQIAIQCIGKNISQYATVSKKYEKCCYDEFGEDLKYSLLFSKLMHGFPNIFFKIFTSNAEILDRYLDISARKTTYKQYFKWLLTRLPKYIL
jgi:geranylgeranyl reductase family protein